MVHRFEVDDYSTMVEPRVDCRDVVCVLEDSAQVAEEIAAAASQFGLLCLWTSRPDIAIRIAEETTISFFILDIHIKNRNQAGMDVLEHIKSLDRDSYVVMYTAHPARLASAAALGANETIEKSGDVASDLAGALGSYLSFSNLDAVKSDDGGEPGASDENFTEFLRLIEEPREKVAYAGLWVGILDGRVVKTAESEGELLQILDREYPDSQVFIGQIGSNRYGLDLPTLFFD